MCCVKGCEAAVDVRVHLLLIVLVEARSFVRLMSVLFGLIRACTVPVNVHSDIRALPYIYN